MVGKLTERTHDLGAYQQNNKGIALLPNDINKVTALLIQGHWYNVKADTCRYVDTDGPTQIEFEYSIPRKFSETKHMRVRESLVDAVQFDEGGR